MKTGFSDEKYVESQTKEIIERIKNTGGRLYLEFGGKLFDDWHAARVLPGFDVNAKVKLLETLKEKAEIVITINASDIERNKIRADYGIDYGSDVLRLIDNLRDLEIYVNSVVITQFEGQPSATIYRQKLERRDIKVYVHTKTKGYPTDIETIISDDGYGQNPYIEATRPLVVITAPGPGSGKLATCLCQLYHEYKMGRKAGYAKFETFPVWNLPLNHPVNVAYEAATADLNDVNMIDPFHLEATGKSVVNYNRDIEVFPIVRTILRKITGENTYNSPTDMGVNMAGFAIENDEIVSEYAKQEIIRRYLNSKCDYLLGITDNKTIDKIGLLMSELDINVNDRQVVKASLERAEITDCPVVAIQLPDGQIVTGRQNKLLSASSSAVLNAIKVLAKINDKINLIEPRVIEPILKMKKCYLKDNSENLTLDETLIALSICGASSIEANIAITKLGSLNTCDAHSNVLLSANEVAYLKKLGLYLTSEAVFSSKKVYTN